MRKKMILYSIFFVLMSAVLCSCAGKNLQDLPKDANLQKDTIFLTRSFPGSKYEFNTYVRKKIETYLKKQGWNVLHYHRDYTRKDYKKMEKACDGDVFCSKYSSWRSKARSKADYRMRIHPYINLDSTTDQFVRLDVKSGADIYDPKGTNVDSEIFIACPRGDTCTTDTGNMTCTQYRCKDYVVTEIIKTLRQAGI